MTINFHDPNNRHAYTTREAEADWKQLIADRVALTGTVAADIGCGGGIYTKALSQLGAAEVIGVDFSLSMLEGAAANCQHLPNCRFVQGNATSVPIGDSSVDVVLERALIHHLTVHELDLACMEAHRILASQGVLIFQDRTPADCRIPGSREHIRGFLFDVFPRLLTQDVGRRHSSQTVAEALQRAGFDRVEETQLWETREQYSQFADFRSDLVNRIGKSILHELTDDELQGLADTIQQKTGYSDDEPMIEKDRWTLWFAYKHESGH